MIPTPRTRKARRSASERARRALREYDAATYGTDQEPQQPYRVQRLLWAMAHLERALAMETQRQMGDPYATANTVGEVQQRRAITMSNQRQAVGQ